MHPMVSHCHGVWWRPIHDYPRQCTGMLAIVFLVFLVVVVLGMLKWLVDPDMDDARRLLSTAVSAAVGRGKGGR